MFKAWLTAGKYKERRQGNCLQVFERYSDQEGKIANLKLMSSVAWPRALRYGCRAVRKQTNKPVESQEEMRLLSVLI